MRWVFLFLIGLLLGACGGNVPATASPAPSLSPLDAPSALGASYLETVTVALVDLGAREPHVYCTAVRVSPTAILTANHCTGGQPLGASFSFSHRGDLFEGDALRPLPRLRSSFLEARDAGHDLALLRIPGFEERARVYAGVQKRDVTQGEYVQSYGHPLGFWFSYSTGVVSAIRQQSYDVGGLEPSAPDMTWIQTTADISPGNSGGGLFNDSGELVGICSWGHGNGIGLNFFVHKMHIESFLARAKA